MRIARFLGELKEELKEKLEAKPNLTYEGLCNSAIVHEKYAKKRVCTPIFPRLVKPPVSTSAETTATPKISSPKPILKYKPNVPMKDVICFKCHGHGHFKGECPNEIHTRSGPRAMLVQINGQEETVLPPTPADGLEGTYVVIHLGAMERVTEDIKEEDDRE